MRLFAAANSGPSARETACATARSRSAAGIPATATCASIVLGSVAQQTNALAQATATFRESLLLAQQADDAWVTGLCLTALAVELRRELL